MSTPQRDTSIRNIREIQQYFSPRLCLWTSLKDDVICCLHSQRQEAQIFTSVREEESGGWVKSLPREKQKVPWSSVSTTTMSEALPTSLNAQRALQSRHYHFCFTPKETVTQVCKLSCLRTQGSWEEKTTSSPGLPTCSSPGLSSRTRASVSGQVLGVFTTMTCSDQTTLASIHNMMFDILLTPEICHPKMRRNLV